MSGPKQSNGAVIIEGHVQGLSNVRALGEIGIPVYVIDEGNCIARYSKYCIKFFKCPSFQSNEFTQFLVDLSIQEKLNNWVLIPSNDHAVYTISKQKPLLENYYEIITPDLSVIENIYDKLKLLRIAEKIGIPVPSTTHISLLDELPESIIFPVVIKGRNGLTFYKTFGRKVFHASTRKVLLEKLIEIKDKCNLDSIIIQESIQSKIVVSYVAFCVKGVIKSYWMGEKIREHPERFGTATFAKSSHYDECHSHSMPLIRKLKYTGVCEIEFILDDATNSFKLIEINPRTWLWIELAKQSGINFAKMIYYHCNRIPHTFPNNYQTGIYWRNPFTDIFFGIITMIRGRVTLTSYFSSIRNVQIVDAIRKEKDNKPFIVYMLLLFRFLKKR